MRASFATVTVDPTGQNDLGMTIGLKKLYYSGLFASRRFDEAVSRTLLWLRRRGGIDPVLVWDIEPMPNGKEIYRMLLEVRQP